MKSAERLGPRVVTMVSRVLLALARPLGCAGNTHSHVVVAAPAHAITALVVAAPPSHAITATSTCVDPRGAAYPWRYHVLARS
jgi:hypothetical protein